MTDDVPVTLALPIAERAAALAFYRDALGLEPFGELGSDGIPEPLRFAVNEGLTLMLVPAKGFGWVIGDREVAEPWACECLLSLDAPDPAAVDALVGRAGGGRRRRRGAGAAAVGLRRHLRRPRRAPLECRGSARVGSEVVPPRGMLRSPHGDDVQGEQGGRVSAPLRLGLFAAGLALVFAASTVAGGAVGPEPQAEPEPAHAEAGGGEHGAAGHEVRGLASAADGLRLVVERPELQRGREQRLAFRIDDDHGATVRHFDVGHTKRMHVIVARRDLTGFQH